MNRFKNIGLILCGLVLGLALSAPAARAAESLKVTLSTNRILVDGKEVRLTAYNINGSNYVMLRDIGKTVSSTSRIRPRRIIHACRCMTARRSFLPLPPSPVTTPPSRKRDG